MLIENLLVIFDHPLAFRSYVETNLITKLRCEYNLTVCTLGKFNVDHKENNSSDLRINEINVDRFEKFILALYSNSYWWKSSSKSLSFQNRTWYLNNKSRKFLSASSLARIYIHLYGKPPLKLSVLILYFLLKRIKVFTKNKNNQKILYITAGGTITMSDQLVKFFGSNNISTYTIVENWDNLSSKAVFGLPPKRLGVWGEQAKSFAFKIHNIDPQKVFTVGNPRIDWIFNNHKPDKLAKDIFFGGGSVDFYSELPYLQKSIEIAKVLNIKVYYLPHPKCYQNARGLVDEIAQSSLIPVGKFVKMKKFDSLKLPQLEEYLEPFSSARVFISSFSTLNLEAAFLGIPSIAIDLKTGKGAPNDKMSQRNDHIADAVNLGIFEVTDNIYEFENLLIQILTTNLYKLDSKNSLSYFVNTAGNFYDRLIKFLK